MPTYDYTCEQCNHTLEARQNITEAPLTNCPKCHNDTLRRGIGGGLATFQFLGDGFYLTDYKKEKESCSPSKCCPCKDSPST